jgi:hypothetical protein
MKITNNQITITKELLGTVALPERGTRDSGRVQNVRYGTESIATVEDTL